MQGSEPGLDSQKRTMLAVALSCVLLAAYSFFLAPSPESAAGADAGVASTTVLDGGALAAAPSPAAAEKEPVDAEPGVAGAAPERSVPPLRTVEVKRPLLELTFGSQGAGLTSAPLQGEKMREQAQVTFTEALALLRGKPLAQPAQIDMASTVVDGVAVAGTDRPLPLALSIKADRPLPATARYRVEEREGALVFTTEENGWEVTKTFTLPPGDASKETAQPFELGYDVTVKNVSADPRSGALELHYGRAVNPLYEEKPSIFGAVGNQTRAGCRVGEDFHHIVPDADPPDAEKLAGPISFFGADHQYFLGAVFPLEAAKEGRCELVATPTWRGASVSFPLRLGPGESTTQRFGVYVGPKDSEMLATVPTRVVQGAGEGAAVAFSPHLEETVDFGIWAVLCKVLLGILKFFHSLSGNWGLAIILLTLLVRVLMVPLAHKALLSAEAMKRLQPKMEELRKKYAEDRERQNLELMKLYQEAKVNPLGGCLPMLIQMPIWIALFTTLRTSYELYREPFFSVLWQDLTFRDPIYFLPVALGVSQVLAMKLQPQMMDPAQAKLMTYVMPAVFTLFMLNYPAGLTLYIFTSNLFQILQQFALRKWIERQGGGGAATPALAGKKR